ncbi:hypothetical protein BT69DRAFT_1343102 [Atractiella rhizophila]|nr:hypothetical protein BT69DRAFT_1343102 [Atractiella rhizophila]
MSSDSSSKLNVLVIGFGAVGILYSYLLEKSGKARVTALARSNYNQALKLASTPSSVLTDIHPNSLTNNTFKFSPNPHQKVLEIEPTIG